MIKVITALAALVFSVSADATDVDTFELQAGSTEVTFDENMKISVSCTATATAYQIKQTGDFYAVVNSFRDEVMNGMTLSDAIKGLTLLNKLVVVLPITMNTKGKKVIKLNPGPPVVMTFKAGTTTILYCNTPTYLYQMKKVGTRYTVLDSSRNNLLENLSLEEAREAIEGLNAQFNLNSNLQ